MWYRGTASRSICTTTEDEMESSTFLSLASLGTCGTGMYCFGGTSTESLPTQLRPVCVSERAAKRSISSVSDRAVPCPIAGSKKKCDVLRDRFSQRTVP